MYFKDIIAPPLLSPRWLVDEMFLGAAHVCCDKLSSLQWQCISIRSSRRRRQLREDLVHETSCLPIKHKTQQTPSHFHFCLKKPNEIWISTRLQCCLACLLFYESHIFLSFFFSLFFLRPCMLAFHWFSFLFFFQFIFLSDVINLCLVLFFFKLFGVRIINSCL